MMLPTLTAVILALLHGLCPNAGDLWSPCGTGPDQATLRGLDERFQRFATGFGTATSGDAPDTPMQESQVHWFVVTSLLPAFGNACRSPDERSASSPHLTVGR
jgi:hypothetical protein